MGNEATCSAKELENESNDMSRDEFHDIMGMCW